MRQLTSIVLLLVIGQVAHCQESGDDVAEEPVVTSSELYDAQFYATLAEGDSTGLIRFELSNEHVYMGTGGFELTESSDAYTGSWFGFAWGPLTFRFGVAASEAGDDLMLGSLAFGQTLIGRASTLASDSHEHYFVFGVMTDDIATAEAGDLPLDDEAGEEPLDEMPVEEPTFETATEDAGTN